MMDNPFLDDGPDKAKRRLADVEGIAAILQQAAREGRAMSYSEYADDARFPLHPAQDARAVQDARRN
jgi:hypothetical protein